VKLWGRTLSLALAGFALLPCAAMADEKYRISAEVWGVYEEYLGRIDNGHKPGAIAITKDGYGAFYVWCSETRCMAGASYSQDAINYCEREYDTDCVTFAVRDDIRVEYEIIGRSSSSAAPALSPAPPTARIKVSAQVKSEIDQYLRNAQRAGRVWALAIANDGSKVGLASCQSTGGGGYFGGGGAGCNLVSGGPQEQASREAILRCGGPTACTLLYEGSQKRANVSVYGPGETPPADQVGAATPPPALPAPPPATKIVVSAAVREDIEVYLRNTQRSGFAWALAIANDGSAVGVAGCQTSSNYFGGSTNCGTVIGSPQEVTNRAAILNCGGTANCMIAFEGAQKKTGIELVGPDGGKIGGNPAAAAPSASNPTVQVATTTPVPASATPVIATTAPEEAVAPASTNTYTLSDQVWRNYQAYLQRTGDGAKPGAFAITPDGQGYAYVWCEQTQCTGSRSYSQEALIDCKQDYGADCVVFAVRNDIRVAYAVADPQPLRASGISNAALSAPPPPTKVVVSPAVKAAIDTYLGNTQTAGKAWALAIAHDGSDVASASCPTSGGWSGGRGCEPIKGRPQELASREAVMRCGGPAACMLLYEGAQPAGNVEIVTQ
jgi:hypothetical protein